MSYESGDKTALAHPFRASIGLGGTLWVARIVGFGSLPTVYSGTLGARQPNTTDSDSSCLWWQTLCRSFEMKSPNISVCPRLTCKHQEPLSRRTTNLSMHRIPFWMSWCLNRNECCEHSSSSHIFRGYILGNCGYYLRLRTLWYESLLTSWLSTRPFVSVSPTMSDWFTADSSFIQTYVSRTFHQLFISKNTFTYNRGIYKVAFCYFESGN